MDEDDAMEVVTMWEQCDLHSGVKKDRVSQVTFLRVKRSHIRPYPRVQAISYMEDRMEAWHSGLSIMARL